MEQISTDHTLAPELDRGGVITREHVERHPHSHVLTRPRRGAQLPTVSSDVPRDRIDPETDCGTPQTPRTGFVVEY